MTRLFLLLVAVLLAATPADAARRQSRRVYYRPVTPTMSTVTRTMVTAPPVTTATVSTTEAAPTETVAATSSAAKTQTSPLQAWAEDEAKMMVARRFKGHVRSAPMGTFVGVGFSTNGRVVTCVGAGQLVAQATVRGTDGYYHVRVWR